MYEYFPTRIASAEGKNSGRVYAACCGSGGMFVQADKFIKAHASGNGNGKRSAGSFPAPKADIAVYGQESNPTTRRLAMMNLAIRGIDGDLGTATKKTCVGNTARLPKTTPTLRGCSTSSTT